MVAVRLLTEDERMELMPRLTTQQVAAHLGVHAHTLRKWEYSGRIPRATRRNGQRVYTPADVQRIMEIVF